MMKFSCAVPWFSRNFFNQKRGKVLPQVDTKFFTSILTLIHLSTDFHFIWFHDFLNCSTNIAKMDIYSRFLWNLEYQGNSMDLLIFFPDEGRKYWQNGNFKSFWHLIKSNKDAKVKYMSLERCKKFYNDRLSRKRQVDTEHGAARRERYTHIEMKHTHTHTNNSTQDVWVWDIKFLVAMLMQCTPCFPI